MKFTVTFKSPDAISGAIADAETRIGRKLKPAELLAAERLFNKYFEYGEYVMVEVDTVTNEARVLSV
jgi:hypothetical protein